MFTHGKHTRRAQGEETRLEKERDAHRAQPCRAFPGERRRQHGTLGHGWRGSGDFPEPASSTQPTPGARGDARCEGDPSAAGTDSSSPPPFGGCTSSHPKTH